MKTKPERQYDIFLVKGEEPQMPDGCVQLTTYDSKLGGVWAMLITGRDGWAKSGNNLGSNIVPSWNEMSG